MNAIDTNVLVYAFDLDQAVKGQRALELIERCQPHDTVLLWRVVCELGAVLTRIGARAPAVRDPRAAIESICARFPLITPSPGTIAEAWRLRATHHVSYWDALLLAACIDAGVTHLYTEDLQGQPVINGVHIVDPFAA